MNQCKRVKTEPLGLQVHQYLAFVPNHEIRGNNRRSGAIDRPCRQTGC